MIFIVLWFLMQAAMPIGAHFIHIDHNEFRVNAFPRQHLPLSLPPPLPPPLPPTPTAPATLPHYLVTKELTPGELMVDLSNDLTYRLLHYHSILNRNNFAFSPTAVMSVLVALYEGSAGRTAAELRNVLQLPSNRDVIRIGYRDIHRRLRTYFFGSDNPLKGLSLNRENITITRDYEAILMFYGYDLSMDMVSSIMPTATTNAATNGNMSTESTNQEMQHETTTTTTTMTTVQPSTEKADITTTGTTTVAMVAKTTEEITSQPSTTKATTTIIATTTTMPAISETIATETTAEAAEFTTTEETNEEAPNEDAAELVSTFVAEADVEPFLRIQKARVTRLPANKLQAPLKQSYPITPKPNYLPSARINVMPSKLLKNHTMQRKLMRYKRHALGFQELDANLFVTLFNSQQTAPAAHHTFYPIIAQTAGPAYAHINNEFELDTEPHFISTTASKQNYNAEVISHVFYLDNGNQQQLVHTTFKVYNAVLYYKYFEHLKMSILELELDTPEYNLMILLPDYHQDIVAAAASLKLAPTLRILRKQLKPRWVQAIIPDFRLHGTMFLTNDLQNLGICDVFEPNRADFRPMTDAKGVYVKHIEQSINVNIRTRPINQLKRNYGAQTKPIQISVNHPFLFFIIDRDLDVAVMAGRILNPLNVRIQ